MSAYDRTMKYISEMSKSEAGKAQVKSREFTGKTTGKKKEYKAIKGMSTYVKDDGIFDLGKCIDDLTGKPGIDNAAAICRAAEIVHTGKAHATTESSDLISIRQGIDLLLGESLE